MGNPSIYYRKALQQFAHNLLIDSDVEIARKMQDEKSIDILEFEIKKIKEHIDKCDLIFKAGFVVGHILTYTSEHDGCDGFNACLGGLNDFEDFIKEL